MGGPGAERIQKKCPPTAPNFAEQPGDIFAASVRKLRTEGDDCKPGLAYQA